MFSPRHGAPHCAFCTLGCGLLFGLWSFLSSLVPLRGCFSFIKFIYLFIYKLTPLLGVVFYLDFGPLFLLLLFPWGVFFLYLFIYL